MATANPNCNWKGLVEKWALQGYTVTFEWVSPSSCIVLKYDEPQLFCTAIRSNYDGKYLTHAEMQKEAAEFGILVPNLIWDSATQGVLRIEDLIARVKSQENLEGCVLKLEDIHAWFKIKSDWYFAQSRSHLLLPSSERQLWGAILSGTMDDLLPKLTPEVRDRVEKFSESLFGALQSFATSWAERIRHLNPRSFTGHTWAQMVKAKSTPGTIEETMLYKSFAVQEDNEYLPILVSIASKNCTAKRFTTMQLELGVQSLRFYASGTVESSVVDE